MGWKYSQSSGKLSHNGSYMATGYSGAGTCKNVPNCEHKPNVGPIPRGAWRIGGYDGSKGPLTIDLEPVGHNAHGRTLFRIHGDSISNPGTASEGCIIMPRSVRQKIVKSADKILEVVQ